MLKFISTLLFLLVFSVSLQADLKSAKKEYSRQHYKIALSLFSEYSLKNPSDGEAWMYQGYIYEHLKNFPKSIEMFKKAADAKLDKKDKITAYVKILIYYQYYKDWNTTATYANRLLKINPGNSVAEKALALANENGYNSVTSMAPAGDDPQSQMRYYENMLKKFPGNPAILWELAFLYYNEGNFSSAESMLSELLSKEKSNRNYYYKAGMVKIKLGKYQEGIDLLSRVLELTGDKIGKKEDIQYYTYFNRANAWYQIGNNNNAEADYKKALAIQKSKSPMIGLERVYYNKRDCQNLMTFSLRVLEEKPSHLESLVYKMYCKLRDKKEIGSEEVEILSEKLLKKYNSANYIPERYHEVLLLMAGYYSSHKKFPQALEYYKVAEKTGNGTPSYNFYRGKSHLYMGQYREAIDFLSRVTGSASAMFLCAKAAVGLGDIEKSKRFILETVALKPEYWNKFSEDETFAGLMQRSEDFANFIRLKGKHPEPVIQETPVTPIENRQTEEKGEKSKISE